MLEGSGKLWNVLEGYRKLWNILVQANSDYDVIMMSSLVSYGTFQKDSALVYIPGSYSLVPQLQSLRISTTVWILVIGILNPYSSFPFS